jgi:hypothetical protein
LFGRGEVGEFGSRIDLRETMANQFLSNITKCSWEALVRDGEYPVPAEASACGEAQTPSICSPGLLLHQAQPWPPDWACFPG